jgi:hypothetical protein
MCDKEQLLVVKISKAIRAWFLRHKTETSKVLLCYMLYQVHMDVCISPNKQYQRDHEGLVGSFPENGNQPMEGHMCVLDGRNTRSYMSSKEVKNILR